MKLPRVSSMWSFGIYTCKLFGLRAADEHKRLEVSQFFVGDEETGHCLRFVGKSCKKWHRGLNQRKVEAQDLKILYADPSLGSRCAVSCFEFYLSLIPSSGQLYHRAIGDHPPRFSSEFSTEAFFRGFFTNLSLSQARSPAQPSSSSTTWTSNSS